jgi:chromosomal replication initiation ATPase DnaA
MAGVTSSDTRLSYEYVKDLYDEITNKVCEHTGCNKELLLSKTRIWNIVKVRHTLVHFLYCKYRNYYYIARYLNKDRASVYHSLRVVSNLWNTDSTYRTYLLNIKQIL